MISLRCFFFQACIGKSIDQRLKQEEAMIYIETGDDQLWVVTLRGGAQGHGERDRPGLQQDQDLFVVQSTN